MGMRATIMGLMALLLAACATQETSMTSKADWTLLVHGGAGVMERATMTPEQDAEFRAGIDAALQAGSRVLSAGGSALDAVEAAVRVLEDDPNFNAGRGAVLTREGVAELDASIMDGRNRAAGSVAQVRRVKNPIRAARLVMESTPHVMFAGPDADKLAESRGLEMAQPDYFITPRRQEQLQRTLLGARRTVEDRFGTVGAVARDQAGNLAAATSTGGMNAKMPGRVGDAPIIGAGTYADNNSCAVSATGHGEYFIRVGVARTICARIAMTGDSAQAAADATLAEIAELGGDGGVIVISRDGEAAFSMNSEGMFRGLADAAGRKQIAIYADE
jgi:L-asparaginase / beta-aspartyl-peptidase